MKTYRITWNERVYFESFVNANSKEEALNMIDEINENCEQLDEDTSACDLEAQEVE
jgi:hypothetical protein